MNWRLIQDAALSLRPIRWDWLQRLCQIVVIGTTDKQAKRLQYYKLLKGTHMMHTHVAARTNNPTVILMSRSLHLPSARLNDPETDSSHTAIDLFS